MNTIEKIGIAVGVAVGVTAAIAIMQGKDPVKAVQAPMKEALKVAAHVANKIVDETEKVASAATPKKKSSSKKKGSSPERMKELAKLSVAARKKKKEHPNATRSKKSFLLDAAKDSDEPHEKAYRKLQAKRNGVSA